MTLPHTVRTVLAGLPHPPLRAMAGLAVGLLAVLPGAPPAAAAPHPAAPHPAATRLVTALPPATPSGLPTELEPLAGYVGQVSCDPGARVGTLALAKLLTATYPGTTFGSYRACGAGNGVSEHYDGRAVDWMNSVRDPVQAAQAAA